MHTKVTFWDPVCGNLTYWCLPLASRGPWQRYLSLVQCWDHLKGLDLLQYCGRKAGCHPTEGAISRQLLCLTEHSFTLHLRNGHCSACLSTTAILSVLSSRRLCQYIWLACVAKMSVKVGEAMLYVKDGRLDDWLDSTEDSRIRNLQIRPSTSSSSNSGKG